MVFNIKTYHVSINDDILKQLNLISTISVQFRNILTELVLLGVLGDDVGLDGNKNLNGPELALGCIT